MSSLCYHPPSGGFDWKSFTWQCGTTDEDPDLRGREVIVFERSPLDCPAQRLVVRANGAMYPQEWYTDPNDVPWFGTGPAKTFPRWDTPSLMDRERLLWSLVFDLSAGKLVIPATIWNRIERETVVGAI